MQDITYKSFNQLQFKADNNNLKIFGYASMFNVKDSQGDVVLPGAFCSTLKCSKKSSIKLLWQHQQSAPIGKLNVVQEDLKGLYIEGEIISSDRDGQKAIALIKENIIDSFSIGYQVVDSFYDKNTRFLKELNLWEVSVVTFPANSLAKLAFC